MDWDIHGKFFAYLCASFNSILDGIDIYSLFILLISYNQEKKSKPTITTNTNMKSAMQELV